MTLSVVTTNNQTGTQTVTVRPVSVTIGQVFTLQLFGVSVSFTATVGTSANVVAGLLAAINASTDPEWSLVDCELNQAGDALLISYSSTAGTLRLWRGDAIAVAQVVRVVPSAVTAGDKFALAINGKLIEVTATAASAANVVGLFALAINDSSIAEWQEVAASVEGDTLLLTANEPGVPFEVRAVTNGISVEETNGTTAATAVNQTQSFKIPVTAGGMFRIFLGGKQTSPIVVGASAATVQTAVTGLSTVGSGNASVVKTTDANDDTYTITFQGTLAAVRVSEMIVELDMSKPIIRTVQQGSSSGTVRNEIQTITMPDHVNFDWPTNIAGDNYTLTLDGFTSNSIYIDSLPLFVRNELQEILQGAGVVADVSVSAVKNALTVEFLYREGGGNQTQLIASDFSSTTEHILTLEVTTTAAVAFASNTNEVQVITLTESPSGGTFVLGFRGAWTGPIVWNAAASAVQSALRSLSTIGAGNVNVSGSAGGPWTVTFVGALAGANREQIQANGSGLTGGTVSNFSLQTIVPSSGPNHWDTAENWLPPGVPSDFDRVRFEFGDSNCLYGLDQSGVTLTEMEISSTYSGSIGLPRQNPNGYLEYRVRDLTVHCPSILIGNGTGTGSGKIQLNTLTTTCFMEIRSSGGSREPGVPAVTWYGDNEATEIVLKSGELGIAIWSDQVAVFRKMEQYGGTLRVDHSTFKHLYAPGQSPSAHETRVELIEL